MLEVIDVDTLQDFADERVGDPLLMKPNQLTVTQSDDLQTKESDYQYPLQEARCPDCDKLLAKKLLGTVSLYCSRCKKEIKFNEKSLTKTK
jgi:phage FluMu protein Com